MRDLEMDLTAGKTTFASAIKFEQWAQTSSGGERVVYARGMINRDIKEPSGVLLHGTMKVTRRFVKKDMVLLVQRRLGEGSYEYIAVKRREHSDRTERRHGPAQDGNGPGRYDRQPSTRGHQVRTAESEGGDAAAPTVYWAKEGHPAGDHRGVHHPADVEGGRGDGQGHRVQDEGPDRRGGRQDPDGGNPGVGLGARDL